MKLGIGLPNTMGHYFASSSAEVTRYAWRRPCGRTLVSRTSSTVCSFSPRAMPRHTAAAPPPSGTLASVLPASHTTGVPIAAAAASTSATSG